MRKWKPDVKKQLQMILSVLIVMGITASLMHIDTERVLADFYSENLLYEEQAEKIISNIKPEWSEAEVALYLHDEIVVRCEYDENGKGNSPYDVLVEGKSKCTGYAATYQDLMERAGIECDRIWSDSLNHEWNLVKIDGQYYHVDAAWDDPVPSDLTAGIKSNCLHKYFLKDDSFMTDGMNENHGSGYDWETYSSSEYHFGKANSSKYNNRFWTGSNSKCVYSNGNWYSVHEKNIVSVEFSKEKDVSRRTYDVNSVWYKRNECGEYNGIYTFLAGDGDRVFYNTSGEVWTIDGDGEQSVAYRIDEETFKKGYIYGITLTEKGRVELEIRYTPNGPQNYIYFKYPINSEQTDICMWDKDHDYEVVAMKSGNCIEEGYSLECCKKCSKKSIKLLGKGDHKYDWVEAVSPTYFSKGFTGKLVCSGCGNVLSTGKRIAKKKLKSPKIKIKVKKDNLIVTYSKVKEASGVQIKYRKKGGKWIGKKRKGMSGRKFKIKIQANKKAYTVKIRSYKKIKKRICYSNWNSI